METKRKAGIAAVATWLRQTPEFVALVT